METLILVLVLTLLVGASVLFGADSRPADDVRATRWWPADPTE
jgi:hypothetical protein